MAKISILGLGTGPGVVFCLKDFYISDRILLIVGPYFYGGSMRIRKCVAGFFILSLLLLSMTTCKELFPGACEKVYFRDESPQDDVVMVPDCVGSYEQSNIKYDAKGYILSYNFSVTCDGKTYTGSVTFTRDGSGVLTSRMLIVNGKDCS